MPRSWIYKMAPLGASLGISLGVMLTGCGGPAPTTDDATVFPEPGVNVSTAPTAKPSTPAASSTAPTTTPAPAAAPSAAVKAEGWGTLKGQITFAGEPKAAKVLQAKGKAEKDPDFCAKDGPIVSESLVVDGATKGVKNVIVYLSKPTAVNEDAKKAALAAAPVFDQVKCVFDPHVLALMVDEPLTIKSSDAVNHNVNVKLKNSPFNSTIAPNSNPTKFAASGAERTPGPVTCDIHPWMTSYWMVLDHPYFAVTDAKGNFEIKNVPAGTQKLVVWQESVAGNGFLTAPSGDEIVIKAGDTITKDIKIEPSKIRESQ